MNASPITSVPRAVMRFFFLLNPMKDGVGNVGSVVKFGVKIVPKMLFKKFIKEDMIRSISV